MVFYCRACILRNLLRHLIQQNFHIFHRVYQIIQFLRHCLKMTIHECVWQAFQICIALYRMFLRSLKIARVYHVYSGHIRSRLLMVQPFRHV